MAGISKEEIFLILKNAERPKRGFPAAMAVFIIENDLYPVMLELACDTDHKIAFRAAWSLEHAYLKHAAGFEPYSALFIRSLPRITDESVKRCYSRILCEMLRERHYRPSGSEAEAIAENVCRWVCCPEAKVANRINCIEVLYFLTGQVEWVADVLEDILAQEMRDPSPGMRSRVGKLRNR